MFTIDYREKSFLERTIESGESFKRGLEATQSRCKTQKRVEEISKEVSKFIDRINKDKALLQELNEKIEQAKKIIDGCVYLTKYDEYTSSKPVLYTKKFNSVTEAEQEIKNQYETGMISIYDCPFTMEVYTREEMINIYTQKVKTLRKELKEAENILNEYLN